MPITEESPDDLDDQGDIEAPSSSYTLAGYRRPPEAWEIISMFINVDPELQREYAIAKNIGFEGPAVALLGLAAEAIRRDIDYRNAQALQRWSPFDSRPN